MAMITSGFLDVLPVLSLDRYQELLKLPMAAFNGLNKPDDIRYAYDCANIWRQTERDNLGLFIKQAEEIRRQELGYFLGPTYVENEEHDYANPIILEWKHLISLGTLTRELIEEDIVIDHGVETDPNDPVQITVVTSVTDTDEIRVYHDGTEHVIHPSCITITGGVATISIPRSRLVRMDLMDDREDPLSYYENDNFVETVDVGRVYVNTGSGINFVWVNTDLSETTQSACCRILNRRISKVYVQSAVCWVRWCPPAIFRTSYVSGLRYSVSNELKTIRFAHSLMPYRPCSCDGSHQYWLEDQVKTDTLTPYGRTAGAVDAWLADYRARVGYGTTVP